MTGWLLMREKHPPFVAPPGQEKSYTTRDKARVFPTREAAEAERCGNETIVRVSGWPT